jgi:uncharacterized protein (DUF885 family)
LLDPHGRGHCLCSEDPSAHVSLAAKNLAVHEAIPGHYLQSAVWQHAFAKGHLGRNAIARFLGVADDVAMSRAYYGTMLSVEGWAVYVERLLHDHGYYDSGAEGFFFAVCDAIRAVRVVLDLELQAGEADPAALVAFVCESTLMPERFATLQVLRAKRMPLQGLTYFVGALEIEELRRAVAPTSLVEFHRALLVLGPVPASVARTALHPEVRTVRAAHGA